MKMAFEEVRGDTGERKETEFFSYKGMEKGFVIEGYLKWKSEKPALMENGKQKFNQDGTPKINHFYFVDMPKWEKSKGLYGCGKLDFLMSKVSLGDYIRFTYLGKEKVDGYESELHQIKLEVDPSKRQMVEVGSSQPRPDDDIPF